MIFKKKYSKNFWTLECYEPIRLSLRYKLVIKKNFITREEAERFGNNWKDNFDRSIYNLGGYLNESFWQACNEYILEGGEE